MAGEDLVNGKLYDRVLTDDCTWCLVEKGSELQVLLAPAADTKWRDLMIEEPKEEEPKEEEAKEEEAIEEAN